APYTHRAALKMFSEVLDGSSASELYVTSAADEHGDHRATYRVVVEAMKETGSEARLYAFLVHAGRDQWPDPGPRYETKVIDAVEYPQGIEWPPPIRLPITPEEAEVKRQALMKHASQWALDHTYLGAFVKTEEVFWPG